MGWRVSKILIVIFLLAIPTGEISGSKFIGGDIMSCFCRFFSFTYSSNLISISVEGYLIILEKKSGNIIRVTDVFQNFKSKKRLDIKPTGFVVGLNKIYLSTSNGRLLVIDTSSGKTISTLKIYSETISKPFIQNKSLFLIKDNSIIKLD